MASFYRLLIQYQKQSEIQAPFERTEPRSREPAGSYSMER